MADTQVKLHYFFLTRFNILLWQKDKEGSPVRTKKWLDHRFSLFEKYCFPSIKNQTCQNFEWIVLFDSTTPDGYKAKIEEYQNECPQLVPVFVKPERGRYFADIFREQVVKRLNENINRVLTTYLDNDDALNERFVEDLRQRALEASDGTFFYYDVGYQYYTDDKFLLQIRYPKNHFVSVVEDGKPDSVKGIFGYGRHYYIDEIKGAKIEHVKTEPMWCEVVHEKNMINDANFLLGTKLVKKADGFGFMFKDSGIKYGLGMYLFRFLPRYMKTFVRRAKHRLIGRQW